MLRRWFSILVLALLFVVAGYLTMSSPTATAAPKNDRGQKLFMTYCASCHGTDAKGNGPAAPALKKAPADLTNIPKDNGKFPALRVRRVIGGDDFISGHGSREMPIWGNIFREQRDHTIATGNIYALTKYVESIQGK
jgi:mono/diheme cytochrome c family protein